jgi:hypothetical protein
VYSALGRLQFAKLLEAAPKRSSMSAGKALFDLAIDKFHLLFVIAA